MREKKYIDIGRRFKEIRKTLDILQAKFAVMLNAATSKISDIENGNSLPSTEMLLRLRDKYAIDISYLLFGEGGMFTHSRDNTKYTIDLTKLIIDSQEALELFETFESSRITQHKLIAAFQTFMLSEGFLIKKELAQLKQVKEK